MCTVVWISKQFEYSIFHWRRQVEPRFRVSCWSTKSPRFGWLEIKAIAESKKKWNDLEEELGTWQTSQRGDSLKDGWRREKRGCLLASLFAWWTRWSQPSHRAASSAQQNIVASSLSHTSHRIFILSFFAKKKIRKKKKNTLISRVFFLISFSKFAVIDIEGDQREVLRVEMGVRKETKDYGLWDQR